MTHPASAKRPAPGERMLMGIRALMGALQRPAVAKRSSITASMYGAGLRVSRGARASMPGLRWNRKAG